MQEGEIEKEHPSQTKGAVDRPYEESRPDIVAHSEIKAVNKGALEYESHETFT
jgi:hypothetical protein